MDEIRKSVAGRKWYENYLPFVTKSPEKQLEWLIERLYRLRSTGVKGKRGLLSREELTPYISLLLDGIAMDKEGRATSDSGDILKRLLDRVKERELRLMVECTEIYDIPKLFGLLRSITRDQAVLAMMKSPPPFEKNPLMVVDRVFHAVKEKSPELLESAAKEIIRSSDCPENFADNYKRFREIMMDEHILSMLYPKAN